MKTLSGILFALFSTLAAQNALADDIRLGAPAYGGTGCPAGSASVSLSPDRDRKSTRLNSSHT